MLRCHVLDLDDKQAVEWVLAEPRHGGIGCLAATLVHEQSAQKLSVLFLPTNWIEPDRTEPEEKKAPSVTELLVLRKDRDGARE